MLKHRSGKITGIFLCLVFCIGLLAGCGNGDAPSPKDPVTLTLWHPYGHHMKTVFEELIAEFNETAGAEKGVFVQTTYIADASELNDKLLSALDGDLGSPELPDLAIIYPKVGVTLAERGLLVDMSTQFNAEELSGFVPEFLEEGKLGGETLYIMPVAKSMEMMYVNTTIFDRFTADTGVELSQLATFEGLMDAAAKYYKWSGGKTFVHITDPFNTAMTGFKQLGGDLLANNSLNLSSPLYERIWNAYYPQAVQGGVTVFEGYADTLFASGEIICGVGTSASVTYFADTVTYADNTKEELNITLLPFPVFEGGEKITLQRGAGICVTKTDARRELAAGTFIKWLTEPAQNLRFTVPLGYLPVTEAAMSGLMSEGAKYMDSVNIRKLYETIAEMRSGYNFYFPAVFDGLEGLQTSYNAALRKAAVDARTEYLALLGSMDKSSAYESVSEGALERFVAEQMK